MPLNKFHARKNNTAFSLITVILKQSLFEGTHAHT